MLIKIAVLKKSLAKKILVKSGQVLSLIVVRVLGGMILPLK
jgi:hypothetical protein